MNDLKEFKALLTAYQKTTMDLKFQLEVLEEVKRDLGLSQLEANKAVAEEALLAYAKEANVLGGKKSEMFELNDGCVVIKESVTTLNVVPANFDIQRFANHYPACVKITLATAMISGIAKNADEAKAMKKLGVSQRQESVLKAELKLVKV